MKKIILILILTGTLSPVLRSQNNIWGRIIIDSAWNPVVYLSLISDLEQMNSMSNEMIIEQATIDSSGVFILNTDFLPEGDNLYRIHIARKNDPPASLIIGGKNENHFFLIINKHFSVHIIDSSRSVFIKDAKVSGYAPNDMLLKIDRIAMSLDTASFKGSYMKAEMVRNSVYDKLRSIADTCTNPLVSLYAIYKCGFDKDYPANRQFYQRYLTKWEKEKSPYFEEFRKRIPSSDYPNTMLIVLVCIAFFSIGIFATIGFLKLSKKDRNHIQELSVQERKIYSLILEGKSNKEISESLNIGLSTVKSHINNIYSKLNINSRKDILNLEIDQKKQ